jgi:hypothetical protein
VRHAAAIGIIGIALVCPTRSPLADRTDAVAGAMAAGAVATIGCWTTALAEAEAESDGDKEKLDYARRGWLVGASGRYAVVSSRDDSKWLEKPIDTQFSRPRDGSTTPKLPRNPVADFSVTKLKRTSFGFDGRAGYRCHQRVSAEVQVEWFDSTDGNATIIYREPTDPRGPLGFAKIDVEPLAVTVNAKGYLMTGRYQPFLGLGAGLLTVKSKVTDITNGSSTTDHTTDFALRFAGGIDLYATRNVAVTLDLDYLLPFGDLEDRDYMSLGVGIQYRF